MVIKDMEVQIWWKISSKFTIEKLAIRFGWGVRNSKFWYLSLFDHFYCEASFPSFLSFLFAGLSEYYTYPRLTEDDELSLDDDEDEFEEELDDDELY